LDARIRAKYAEMLEQLKESLESGTIEREFEAVDGEYRILIEKLREAETLDPEILKERMTV
jgi:hypothetical protein